MISGREKITGEIKISSLILEQLEEKIKNIPDFEEAIGQFLTEPISEILETIFLGGIKLEASDIHFEPQEKQVQLRIRIDGILQRVIAFDHKLYRRILNRVKLLSGLKINITGSPQDGRFTILMEEVKIEVRTSTLPSEYGESIVLRVLNPKSLVEIEKLGLRKDLFTAFRKEITRPNGMIIVTGPTGSGKTTTLYAVLRKIQKPEIKIITIEDPIEYHLKGISQTQVDPKKGYDFASGLKSIMRQDPDVILVGEIRDLETAKIALQAALTGHLVLTTLHTNDAAGTVVRLTSLGAKTMNIGPALNVAIAQRLVRRVCPKCKVLEKPSSSEFEEIKKTLRGIPGRADLLKIDSKLKIPRAKGCKACNFTGYRGRIGIFEAFLVDDRMEKFILTNPSIADLRQEAVEGGMIPMRGDGMIKVLEGMTTLEEVKRVTGELKN